MIGILLAAQAMIVTPLPGGGWDVKPQIAGQGQQVFIEPVPGGGYVVRPAIIQPVPVPAVPVVPRLPPFDWRERESRDEPR
jgi:hypothetical protein